MSTWLSKPKFAECPSQSGQRDATVQWDYVIVVALGVLALCVLAHMRLSDLSILPAASQV